MHGLVCMYVYMCMSTSIHFLTGEVLETRGRAPTSAVQGFPTQAWPAERSWNGAQNTAQTPLTIDMSNQREFKFLICIKGLYVLECSSWEKRQCTEIKIIPWRKIPCFGHTWQGDWCGSGERLAWSQLWGSWGHLGSVHWGHLELGTRVKSLDSSFKLKGHIKMLLAWEAKALPMGKAANLW